MPEDRSIPRDALERMVRTVAPSGSLENAQPEPRGHTAVYRVELGTADGVRRAVLKAAPDDDAHGILTESRLLALLDDRTAIPVPAVIGAVDDHDELPAPYFLMDAVEGTARPYQETRSVPDQVIRRMARETGAYLAELHALEAVDAFGAVRYAPAVSLKGGRPSADLDRFGVPDGVDDWADFLRRTTEPELDRLGRSRFAEFAPTIRSRLARWPAEFDGQFGPVLGRIDHGVHNLLAEPVSGAIVALIDWGFALAVTPGYDLRTVEYVLSGAVLAPLDDASDRRTLVRGAMRAGYNERGAYPADELAAHGDRYELLAVVRAMNHLEDGQAKVPAGSEDVVAAGLRADARRLLA